MHFERVRFLDELQADCPPDEGIEPCMRGGVPSSASIDFAPFTFPARHRFARDAGGFHMPDVKCIRGMKSKIF